MRLALAATVLLLAAAARPAEALTIRDVIELTKAGVSEEVLLALIDVDGGVYASDTETLKALKAAGVSERVMVALVRSGRERQLQEPAAPPPAPPDEAQAPPPQVVVIEHHEPQVQQVVVPVPVYVPVYSAPSRRHRDPYAAQRVRTGDFAPSNYVPFQPAPPVIRQQVDPGPPVYWGFGGKRRPDAWAPSPGEREPVSEGDRKPEPPAKRK